MTAQLIVTVTAGDRRLRMEIADGVVTVLEAAEGSEPRSASTDPGAVQAWLPATRGADFAITAHLRSGPRPS